MSELNMITIDGIEYDLPSGGGEVPENIVLLANDSTPSTPSPRDADMLGGQLPSYYATKNDLMKIGERVNSTKFAVSCPNAGASTKIAEITLTKGIWFLGLGGYTPDPKGESLERATMLSLDNGTWSFLSELKNQYVINTSAIIEVNTNQKVLNLNLTNWESVAFTATTNYDFYAIRIK